MTLRELGFICYAGLIRGAIAFGLVLKLDDTIINREVIITCSLSLVIITTIFFGSTVSLCQKLILPPIHREAHRGSFHEEYHGAGNDEEEEKADVMERRAPKKGCA